MSDEIYHSEDYYVQLAKDRFPDVERFKFKPKGNRYDSLEPLTDEVRICTVCDKPIQVAIFQNDGVCSVNCQKARDGEKSSEQARTP